MKIIRPAGAALAGLVGYLALALALFAGTWARPAEGWIGDSKDPRLFIWYLGWLPHQLAAAHNPLFTTTLAYPDGVNLMWNTSVLFPALLLWPVTALLGPIVAYNVMVTSAIALSAWLGMLAARRFLPNPAICALVGLIYGFSPGLLAQAARHPHVAIGLFPPLALILGHEILVRRRWRPALVGAGAGAAAALQLLTGEEVLAVTGLIAVIGVALVLALNRGQPVRPAMSYASTSLAVALVVFALVAAYPLWFQFFGPQHVSGPAQHGDVYVTDLLAFLTPNQALLQGAGAEQMVARFTGNPSEDDAYLGLPLLLLFLIGAVLNWRRPALRWMVMLTLAIALLSLGPHLHIGGRVTPLPLPWQAIARVPLMESALPGRLMLIAYLGVGIVAGSGIARATNGGRLERAAATLLMAVALASLLPALPYPRSPAEVPAFFRTGGGIERIAPGTIVLVTPFSSSHSTAAMLWQSASGYRFRMPEGDAFTPGPYLGPRPTFLESALERLDDGQAVSVTAADRDQALADLARWRVNIIVVGPSTGQVRIAAYLTDLLGQTPVDSGGVQVWWSLGDR